MIQYSIFANRDGWQRRMAALACDNDFPVTIPNQPCDTQARSGSEHRHRGSQHGAPSSEREQILLYQMRQRQRGCLEVIDEPNSLKFELVAHLSAIDDPGTVSENAAFAF